MIAPIPAVIISRLVLHIALPYNLLIIVPWTTICWVMATLVTQPVKHETLTAFYHKVQPEFGFEPIRKALHYPPGNYQTCMILLFQTTLGIIATYSLLFGIGAVLLHKTGAYLYLIAFVVSFMLVIYSFRMTKK
jgi:hypothetical protein